MAIKCQILREFSPLKEMKTSDLMHLASSSDMESLARGKCLFERGSNDNHMIFLVEGTLRLIAEDGKEGLIESGTEGAKTPISRLVPRRYTVIAESDAKLMRFQLDKIEELVYIDDSESYEVHDSLSDSMGLEGEILAELYSDIEMDALDLPSLPRIAMQAIELLKNNKCDVKQLELIIQADPAIAAKLLKLANSALYASASPASSISVAIVRIGFDSAAQLIVSFAMNDVFTSKSPKLNQHMHDLWRHSVHVAALSRVLAEKTRSVDPEKALLAGLLHDVGAVAIISYVCALEVIDRKPLLVDKVIHEFCPDVGASILKSWGFDQEFVITAMQSETWGRDSGDRVDCCDIVLIAQLHDAINHPDDSKTLPPMFELPAFKKLRLSELDPETGLEILTQAEDRVDEIKAALGG